MADLTVIALAEYEDGESESFGTEVRGVDVTRGELEATVADALIDAGENMRDSIDTVDEFRDWAHEKVDGGVVVGTSGGEDNIPKGEEYCYSSFNERWDDNDVPDGWVMEDSDLAGVNFRKEENVTTIDPDEWFVGGLVFRDSGIAEETEAEAQIDDYYYYFSQEDNIPIAITEQVSGGYSERSEAELIDALEDNI